MSELPDGFRLVSFDLETHLIQPGLLAPPVVCGSFAGFVSGESKGVLVPRDAALEKLEALLEDEKAIISGANIAYDFGCVLAARPELLAPIWKAYEDERVWDVQIAAALNAIADGRMRDGDLFRRDGSKIQSGRYSLDECVKEWLQRTDAKSRDRWRLSYAVLEDLPIEQWPWDARQYPIDDAVNTLDVARAQAGLTHVAGARNLNDLPAQCFAAFCLHLGSMWGIRTDGEAVAKLEASVQSHLLELRDFAVEQGFMGPKSKRDPTLKKDTKKLKEAVFAAYKGLPPKTAGGDISISREALEDSNDERLVKFAEVGKWEKFNTYLPTLTEAARVPLNVKPNVLLSTGRTSYDGLIQLMPRKGGIRECFVARPGKVWSSVDYAAIEMSTLAEVILEVLGYSELADAINAGMDPHCILGADLIGCGYDEFMKRRAAKDALVGDIRQAGKAANFGFPGMMGAVKFVIAKVREGSSVCEWFFRDGRCGSGGDCAKTMVWNDEPLDMPLCTRCIVQAGVLREAYLGRWKEIRPYWGWVMRELEANDCIVQLVSGRIRGSPHGPAAANTMFQGLAADGAKRALKGLTREMYLRGDALAWACPESVVERIRAKFGSRLESPLFGSRLGIFAHDETLVEMDESVAHDAAHRQAEVMVDEMKTVVRRVAVKAEPALMRRWYKAAEPVYVDGKLVPWEPKPETKSAA